MRITPTTHGSRGFTLLELLVSIAILGAVFGLIGAMWGQAGKWNTDIERHADGLRLQRVISMMKDQWADRRRGVTLGEKKSDVMITDKQVSFTTASPILFPEWPLVVATYRFEQELEPGRAGLWRLVYEESRVASATVSAQDLTPKSSAWLPGRDPRGRPVRDRMVLVDGMTWARIERFGVDEVADQTISEKAREKAEDEAARATDTAKDDEKVEPGNFGIDTDQHRDAPKNAGRKKDKTADSEDEDEPGLKDTEAQKLAKRDMWRPMKEGGYSGVIPAVRLIAERDKEEFACVFVIQASR